MTTRAEFIALVRSYVGTPYHDQGRIPGVGMDCPGPLICACWALGLKPRTFDIRGYSARPDGVSIKRHCDEHMAPVEQDDMQAGDVLLAAWGKGPPQHMGILFEHPHGGLAMVHADNMRAKRVGEIRVEFGRAMRFVAAYAVPGLT